MPKTLILRELVKSFNSILTKKKMEKQTKMSWNYGFIAL